MRTSDVDILMVPGWQGSGPGHWQSRWQRNLTTARRLQLDDWIASDKDRWVGAIITAVATSPRPVVLVAHSLGVIAAVHAAMKLPRGSISGAFLVAPADIEDARAWPAADGVAWPESSLGFAPVPLAPLSFSSVLITSSDDRYCRPERARHFAAAWGSELIEVGPAGHITAESGYGPWPDGVLRFGRFLARLTP
jgi:predicted alpha/beta hydrolase family esterase